MKAISTVGQVRAQEQRTTVSLDATALMRHLWQVVSSPRLSLVLGIMAMVAVWAYQFTGEHPVLTATVTMTAVAQCALSGWRDIMEKGDEL